MTLGNYLVSLRECAGLSLCAAAIKTGLSKSYLWTVEHDRNVPTLTTAMKICKVYKCSLNQMGAYLPTGKQGETK